jgi:hypothetical protein
MTYEASGSIPEPTAWEEPISEPEIAALAYIYWQQQGCPFPTSGEENWQRAEKELREQRARRSKPDLFH